MWVMLCDQCRAIDCRKKKVVHKTTTTDDKRLQNTLKRLGINSIPAIEEVNLFMDSGEVIHFTNPKGSPLNTIIFHIVPALDTVVTDLFLCALQCKHQLPPTPTLSLA